MQTGAVNWLPDLQHADHGLLHLAFDGISAPWRRRLSAARDAGHAVTVALPPEATDLDTLAMAQEVGARLILTEEVEDGHLKLYSVRRSDLVALYDLYLGRVGLQRLAEPLLDLALAEPNAYRKGLYFEQVLCLLFSQVSYLHVLSHRYINETEEIDVVLGNRAAGEMHGVLGGRIVLVREEFREAHWRPGGTRASKDNRHRRGRCTFGYLCACERSPTRRRQSRSERQRIPRLPWPSFMETRSVRSSRAVGSMTILRQS